MNSGMFKSSVKTTTPAKQNMQNLCLTVFWLLAIFLPLGVQAQAAPSPADSMGQQVRVWLSQTHGVAVKDVVIAPLDQRLVVQTCQKPLTVDHPFASKETVRVRCTEPVWQLYLQVKLPTLTPPTTAKNNPGSGSGSANSANLANSPPTASTGTNNNPANAIPPRTVVVAKRLLQRGTVLQADMLEETQVTVNHADTQLLSSLKDAQQAELTRDMPAGQPLRISDIRRAVMVKQGQVVMLTIGEKSEFQISVRMEALQDGRLGDQVKLRNPESGRQVSGIVTGLNTAKGL
jgi:flagella basal body P-ring formation protein FlgA